MSGVDALGLALGVLSVTLSILDKYRGRIKSQELSSLCLELEIVEENYRNSIEELFGEIFTRNEVQQLLSDPQGRKWKESSLTKRLTEVLGDRSRLLFNTADHIKETLEELKRHLPPLMAIESESHLKRIKKVAKLFYKGPGHKASLDRCGKLVGYFQELCDRSKRLAPVRALTSISKRPLLKLRLHQKNALALHDAIRGGWQCQHDHSHVVNLRLDMWNPDDDHLQFEFFFSRASGTGTDRSSQWRRADIKMLPPSETKIGQEGLSLSETPPGEIIDDLCRFLESLDNSDDSPGACLGILIDETSSQTFGIFGAVKEQSSDETAIFTPLNNFENFLTGKAGVLQISSWMPLALTLSLNLLQLQNTHWLEEYWTSEHIRLINSNKSFQPYVTHHFESVRRGSFGSALSLTPSQQSHSLDIFVRNKALFSLGIMLIELCYKKAIDDLAKPEDRGSVVLTAMRLVNDLEEMVGSKYELIVRNCLFCNFDTGTRAELTDERFFEGVYENIVQPLKEQSEIAVTATV